MVIILPLPSKSKSGPIQRHLSPKWDHQGRKTSTGRHPHEKTSPVPKWDSGDSPEEAVQASILLSTLKPTVPKWDIWTCEARETDQHESFAAKGFKEFSLFGIDFAYLDT
jgi:hypothetical protein